MKAKERAALIDKGYKLDAKIKAMQKELKAIKSELVREARQTKKDCVTFNGGKYFAKIVKKETNIYEPETIFNALKEKRQSKRFYDCVNVNVAGCKNLFTCDELEDLADDYKTSRAVTFMK